MKKLKTEERKPLAGTFKFEIDKNHLQKLLFWARRYCDGRKTNAPYEFNEIYKHLEYMYGTELLRNIDSKDETLSSEGHYWPYAQDGMYEDHTGRFNAT